MVMKPITVVSSRFLSSDELDLRIEKKPFSFGQNFTVTNNADGGVIFDIRQNFFSLLRRKVMFDAAGTPVLSLHKKLWSFKPGWDVFKGDSDERIFCAKRSSFFSWIKSLNVFLECNTKENVCDFKVIKSGWFDKLSTIYSRDGTTAVAKMRKKYTFNSFALGKDRYDVTVYPNVDYAFIIALVVIILEYNEENSEDINKSAE